MKTISVIAVRHAGTAEVISYASCIHAYIAIHGITVPAFVSIL